ncbi:unnamed protein product [Lasius platythorax]|uniref:Uncharacterized protein n=1 Tax=Lasius platythorax TaxID=488582 RepID=A0AAV2MWQ9_9HYME
MDPSMAGMEGSVKKGGDSPPGRARSLLRRASMEGSENEVGVSDHGEALGPPSLTPSTSKEKSEDVYLSVLEHLNDLKNKRGINKELEEDKKEEETQEENEDAILSEDFVSSVLIGIAEKCKEDDTIKSMRPASYTVKKRKAAEELTTSEEKEGEITQGLKFEK